jgi:hypothetical protein
VDTTVKVRRAARLGFKPGWLLLRNRSILYTVYPKCTYISTGRSVARSPILDPHAP